MSAAPKPATLTDYIARYRPGDAERMTPQIELYGADAVAIELWGVEVDQLRYRSSTALVRDWREVAVSRQNARMRSVGLSLWWLLHGAGVAGGARLLERIAVGEAP